MIAPNNGAESHWPARILVASMMVALSLLGTSTIRAQQFVEPGNADTPAAIEAGEIREIMSDQPEPEAAGSQPSGIDLLTLMTRGGGFMIPIGLMSLMVVALACERLMVLRRRVIMPPRLVQDLREMANPINRFDPTAAMQTCRQDGSPAGRVIQSMLLRTGQPLGDVERAATETIQREADRCASPIRWLTLAAAATPLMGLLGTVWGMIKAFHESTTLTPDRTRSEQLSEGIYTALVTTLAGLVVAIPAAILALYLENRLAKLFHRVEEFAFEIAPGLARFVGTRRMDADGVLHPMDGPAPPTASEAIQPPPPPEPKQQRGGAKAG